MIYEKQIFQNISSNNDIFYTGLVKTYSRKIFGIRWFPKILYVTGITTPYFVRYECENMSRFDSKNDCEKVLDYLIGEYKIEYSMQHPIKSKQIL